MQNRGWKISLGLFFVVSCMGGMLLADSTGPLPARTGDFGEQNCTACHSGNALNDPAGSFAITGTDD